MRREGTNIDRERHLSGPRRNRRFHGAHETNNPRTEALPPEPLAPHRFEHDVPRATYLHFHRCRRGDLARGVQRQLNGLSDSSTDCRIPATISIRLSDGERPTASVSIIMPRCYVTTPSFLFVRRGRGAEWCWNSWCITENSDAGPPVLRASTGSRGPLRRRRRRSRGWRIPIEISAVSAHRCRMMCSRDPRARSVARLPQPGEVWSGEYTADGIARRLAATTKSRRSRADDERCRARSGRYTERRRSTRVHSAGSALPQAPFGSCNFRGAPRL